MKQVNLPAALRAAEPLAAAFFGVVLVGFIVATHRMIGFAVSTSDFQDYCFALKSYGAGRMDLWPSQRTVLAGLPAALLTPRLGTLGALTTAALLDTFGWMLALYAWAWALGGRRAAWFTLAWVALFGPLVLLTRTISFYPTIALVQVGAAAAVAGALARGSKGWLAAAAVALGLLPLADLRSVLFLLALLPTAMLAGVVAPGSWKVKLLATAAPIAAVALAWRFGGWAYPASSASLQSAVFRYAQDAASLAGVSWTPPDGERSPAFRWAHGSPGTLRDAVEYLRAVDASRPAALVSRAALAPHARELQAMFPLVGVGAVFAVVALRRPRALAAFLLTATPFLLVLRSALTTLPHPRQLALGVFVFPLVLGLGCAGVLQLAAALRRFVQVRRGNPSPPGLSHLDRGVAAAFLLFVLLVVTGALPTPFRPDARWRAALTAEDEPRESIAVAKRLLGGSGGAAPPERMCAAPLRDDAEAGFPLTIPWFPEAPGPNAPTKDTQTVPVR